MKSRLIRSLLIVLLIGANIGCDQVSKTIARDEIEYRENIPVIGDNLILTKVENKGAFLGLGSELPDWQRTILLLILPAIVMVGLLVYLLIKTDISRPNLIGLSFIVGGGIGNLFDRIVYGSVTDFLHMDFEIFRTGIFNMADVSVMVGTGLIFVYSFKKQKPEVELAENTAEGEA